MIPHLIRLLLLGSLISVWGAGNICAQVAPSPVSFETLMTRWSRVLEEIDRYVQGPEHNPERSADYRIRAEHLRTEALAAKTEAEGELAATQELIEALGPATGEGHLPESEGLASERHLYTERSLDLRTRIALAELIAVQADGLARAIVALRRQAAINQYLTRDPSVLLPSTLMAASGQFLRLVDELARLHAAWWVPGSPLTGDWRGWIGPAMWILLVALVSWALRYLILTHFGRDAYITEPSYSRRFAAAIAEGLARAVFPALIFVFIIVVLGQAGPVGGRSLNRIYTGLLVGLALFVLMTALTKAVLAPDLPAWQLAELAAEKARAISRRVTFLAAVFAFDRFLVIGFAGYASSFGELTNVLGVLTNFLLALGILALTPGHLWRVYRAEGAAEAGYSGSGDTGAVSRDGGFWRYLRGLVAIMAVLGIAALAIGYGYIAEYLLHNILFTGIIFGFLFLVRGLVAELPVSLLRFSSLGRDIGTPRDPMTGPRVGLSNLFTAFLALVGLALCFPFWARGFMLLNEVWSWTRDILKGFTVGNVTISLTDIMAAIGAFFAVLILTGVLQRILLQKLLPQTRLTSGLQHSIATGTGYLGIVVALGLAIAIFGVDLTNIALVAGALSVGIGFGLQGVVNNFVSGLILLFERPIRVGDWVVMNNQSGFIKRINIRATELETFDKSSVIIPNADVLANMVVNWTHKDDFGRVDVRVGVAYDADTERVREVLLSCAREHPLVLVARYPGLEPFVLFQDYGRNRLEFELRCYTAKVVERTVIASDLRFEIESRFREEDIKIPLPQEVLHFPGGWPPTVPGDNA